jgi:hypothetical protein
MNLVKIISTALFFVCAQSVFAQTTSVEKTEFEKAQSTGKVSLVIPIYSQIVSLKYPAGFSQVFEKVNGNFYIQEHVLTGETVENWTQMLTITGIKDLSKNEKATPQVIASSIANGFQKSCPNTYITTGLAITKFDGFDGFYAYVSCGSLSTKTPAYSESMVMIVVKGESDIYTIQWAEKAAASLAPIKFDPNKWDQRLRGLSPIRLCTKAPGETSPYPSCFK